MGLLDKIFNTSNGYTKVNIQEFINAHIKGGAIPTDVFIELQNQLLAGKKYAILKNDIILSIKQEAENIIEDEKLLYGCTDLNNKGIEQEKNGDIDGAILTYEKNIKSEYPDWHSYDRLMILYRKRKEYSKEIDVIEKAIIVFSKENEWRAKQAIGECPSKASEIQSALNSCAVVYGDKISTFTGKPMVCFNPYDVNKYRRRLEKAKLLKSKNQ